MTLSLTLSKREPINCLSICIVTILVNPEMQVLMRVEKEEKVKQCFMSVIIFKEQT